MKITKEQLKQIIKEELEAVMENDRSEIDQIVKFNYDSGTVDSAIQQLENAMVLIDDVEEYYQSIIGDTGLMRFVNAILNDMGPNVHPGYHEY